MFQKIGMVVLNQVGKLAETSLAATGGFGDQAMADRPGKAAQDVCF